jgi:hypothetical protein
MIKKITTMVSTNRQVIARKALIIGGVALGIVAGALLIKPEEETIVVVGETVEDESTTETSPEEN